MMPNFNDSYTQSLEPIVVSWRNIFETLVRSEEESLFHAVLEPISIISIGASKMLPFRELKMITSLNISARD